MQQTKITRYTAGQLRRGFEKMPRPCPASILFGLDTDMTAEQVITLTWTEANRLGSSGMLSEYACHIINSQPRHISCKYVFWVSIKDKPMPLFGLESLVFEHFGLLWKELQTACDNLIWVDEHLDAVFFMRDMGIYIKN